MLKSIGTLIVGVGLIAGSAVAHAHGSVGVGITFGVPAAPVYVAPPPPPVVYYPRPVYVAPQPVYVAPAPVYYGPPPPYYYRHRHHHRW